jgi:hypothetical protein
MEKDSSNEKKAGIAKLFLDQINFKMRKIIKDKEENCLRMKRSDP